MAAVLDVKVRPLGVIGAEIQGVDLARVSEPEIGAIKQAWYRHDVLVFRNQKLSDGTGREPRHFLVSPAGKDDRHLRPEHNSGGVSIRQERQALGEHVSSLEIGNHQHVRAARYR